LLIVPILNLIKTVALFYLINAYTSNVLSTFNIFSYLNMSMNFNVLRSCIVAKILS
jgi:hypothetical protein